MGVASVCGTGASTTGTLGLAGATGFESRARGKLSTEEFGDAEGRAVELVELKVSVGFRELLAIDVEPTGLEIGAAVGGAATGIFFSADTETVEDAGCVFTGFTSRFFGGAGGIGVSTGALTATGVPLAAGVPMRSDGKRIPQKPTADSVNSSST